MITKDFWFQPVEDVVFEIPELIEIPKMSPIKELEDFHNEEVEKALEKLAKIQDPERKTIGKIIAVIKQEKSWRNIANLIIHVLAIVGFVAVVVLGVWLLVAYLKTKRDKMAKKQKKAAEAEPETPQ